MYIYKYIHIYRCVGKEQEEKLLRFLQLVRRISEKGRRMFIMFMFITWVEIPKRCERAREKKGYIFSQPPGLDALGTMAAYRSVPQ